MRKYLVLILGLLFLSIGFSLIYFIGQSGSVSNDSTQQRFIVNLGDGVLSIASRLEKNHLVNSRYVFLIHAYLLGLNSRLQAGSFNLSPSLSTSEVVKKLSSGGSTDYWLKIIDGQRIEELSIKFPSSFEGYLFPDSYLIPEDYSQEQILSIIKTRFQEKFSLAKVNATNTSMSDPEIVTLASLLEREGRTLETKQRIAGILLNRLGINMALQVDATVQYARDKNRKVFWQPVTKSDLKIKSAYNTYLNTGLPPTPICNPGYNSLFAAFHPIPSDYLYYITDNSGNIHFAKTLEDHNSNISKYLR